MSEADFVLTLTEAPEEYRLPALCVIMAYKAGSVGRHAAVRALRNVVRAWDRVPAAKTRRVWLVGNEGIEGVECAL